MPLFATLISISKHGRFRAHTEVRRADLMLQLFPAWRSRRLQPPDRESGVEGKRGDLGGGRINKKKKKEGVETLLPWRLPRTRGVLLAAASTGAASRLASTSCITAVSCTLVSGSSSKLARGARSPV